jgi:hypothetical protein
MTFIINSDGELEAIDEESVSLESDNEYLTTWLEENSNED